MRTSAAGRSWGRRALVAGAAAVAMVLAPAVPAYAGTADDTASEKTSGGSDKANSGTSGSSAAQDEKATERKVREEAAAEQRVRDAASEARAQAQAAAENRASNVAAAGQRARASWEAHERPNRMILIKLRSIDLVAKGRLIKQVPQSRSALTIPVLERVVPDEWLSISGGVADLNAVVVLTRGISLTLGGDVKAVRMAGGETVADAASIYTGRGRLVLRDLTIGSADLATGKPLPMGAGRPFIVASGGRLDATDTVISDLGTDPSEPAPRPGVSLGQGSTGTLLRTTLQHNSTGLKLDRTAGVRLEAVTVAQSQSDGLVLRGDTGTTLIGVNAIGNDGNGVLVNGPPVPERPVAGISASENRLFGVALLGQDNIQVNDVATAKNAVGGLRVSWSTNIAVRDIATTDDPIGVYTHVGSEGITLDRITVAGARRGLQIEKTTRKLQVTGATIGNSSIAGVSISGHEVELRDIAVSESPTGIRVERGAGEVIAERVTLTGGEDGIVALPATRNVVVRNVSATDVSKSAIRSLSSGLQLQGGRIVGGSTGIDVGAATTISNVTIVSADEGIRARSPEPVIVDGTIISTGSVGLNVAPGSPTTLTGSQIDALESIRGEVNQQGENTLSLPPLNLIGAIGVPLIVLALVLEQVQALRQRSVGYGRRLAPPPVQVPAAVTGDAAA